MTSNVHSAETLLRMRALCVSPFLQTPILPKWLMFLRHIPFLHGLHRVSLGELIIVLPLAGLVVAGYLAAFVSPSVEESGNIAFYAIAITFVLANKKNSALSILFGVSWERLVPIHYAAGIVALLLSGFHGWVAYTGVDDSGDDSSEDRRSLSSDDSPFSLAGPSPDLWKYLWDGSTNFSGSMATFFMAGLIATSAFRFFFRRFFFEVWLLLHVGLSVGVVVWCLIHEVGLMGLVAGWWALDWFLRFVIVGCAIPNIPTKATLRNITKNVVEVRFPRKFQFEAGQFLRVAVPAVGGPQFHPVTISSAPFQNEITLHLKELGGWTRGLVEYAKTHKQVNVVVEGPYGALSFDLAAHSRVLLVCGGIGSTPIVSLARQLLYQRRRGDQKSIRVIWVVRDLDLVKAMPIVGSSFPDLEKQDTSGNTELYADQSVHDNDEEDDDDDLGKSIQIDVFVTKTKEGAERPSLGPAYSLHFGSRPDIDTILEEEAMGSLAVVACGPQKLVDATAVACRMQSACGKRVDFHNEVFDY